MNETRMRRLRETVGSVYDADGANVHMPGMRTAQTLRRGEVPKKRDNNTSRHVGTVQRI